MCFYWSLWFVACIIFINICMKIQKYGFVYIWRDKKHKRYYIGSHWGTKEDGYICSSTWMRHAKLRRPNDFRRRILKIVFTNRIDTFNEEQRWLNKIKDKELGKKYYNQTKNVFNYCWFLDEEKSKLISEKIRNKVQLHYDSPAGEETKRKISEATKKQWLEGRIFKPFPRSEETKRKISEAHLRRIYGVEFKDRKIKVKVKNYPRYSWNKGKIGVYSEETIDKMSISATGRIVTEKTREKLRQVNLGKKQSEETKNKHKQYRPSEETINKLKNIVRSEEFKNKISKALKGIKKGNGQKGIKRGKYKK